MNISQIKYKTKTATVKEIYSHLKECNYNSYPHLDERVNVKEYSIKLFDKSVTFEAWVDNILVGLVATYFNDMENRSGYITNVSITKNYMGLGIASELMNMCIRYASQYNFKEIELEVYKDNNPAILLYKKYGFMDCKNRGDFVLMKLTGL
jgi:ribosomal protein S18 acetylase RimI-like enzyme